MKRVVSRSVFATICFSVCATVALSQQTVTTTGGTTSYLPRFSGTATVVSSEIYDNGKTVGIGVGSTPNSTVKLDVGGAMIVRGNTVVSRTGNATASSGNPSWGFDFFANAYNSSSKTDVNPYFSMQAEPAGNNTASPSATFNLLFGNNGSAAAETGFYINADGTLHFASAQTFPIAAGPQGPQGPQGPTGPQGPAGSFTIPYAASGSGSGGYLFSLTDTGSSGGGGIYASGESNGRSGSGVAYGGVGVTGQGGSGEGSSVNYGGAGVAGYGGSSVRPSTPAGPGVMGTGGTAGSAYTAGGDGGSFTGGNSSYGAGVGVLAVGGNLASGSASDASGSGIIAYPGNGGQYAGYFEGNVEITGNTSHSASSFKIDDPVDPANKYVTHSSVESSEMKNIYDGNVVTDGSGYATVVMPDWFEALNTDFRYQLTTIGSLARATVESEISNGRFTIRTERGNVKVSWQVTGVRQDAWANAHRIPVEQDKPEVERGHYIHPELFGHAGEASISDLKVPSSIHAH